MADGLRDGLAAALHARCEADWAHRFAHGAVAVTQHGPGAHRELATALLAAEPLARIVRVESTARALLDVELSVNDPDEAPGNPLNKAVMNLRDALGEDGA